MLQRTKDNQRDKNSSRKEVFTSVQLSPRPSRIAGYDLARAIALMGMVFVNYKYISEADQYDDSMLLRLSDWFDGRPAATFVVLAGI